jgi:cell division septation protein DedD
MATPATQEASVKQPEKARPVGIRIATVVQGVEAVGITAAAIAAAVVTADGRNFQLGNEIGLTLIAFAAACGLAAFTLGLHRVQPWSRTPVFLTQLFVGGAGLFLLDAHRWGWGIAAVLLALICLVGLFTPASFRALNRPPYTPEPDPAPSKPVTARPPKSQPASAQSAKSPPAKSPPAKSQQAKNQSAKSPPAKSSPARGRPNQNRPAKKATR